MKALAGNKQLTTLYLAEDVMTDRAFRDLREIGLLHSLWQAGGFDGTRAKSPADVIVFHVPTHITDQGFKELADFKNLRRLSMAESKVREAAMKDVARFPHLTVLLVNFAQATPAGIKELAPLKQLNYIQIGHWGNQVTDARLQALREIGLLHALSQAEAKDGARPSSPDDVVAFKLRQSKLTGHGLKELNAFKNLTLLELVYTEISVAELQRLDWLKQLTALTLEGPKVTDADMKTLAGLVSLTSLSLESSGVTDKGVARLTSLVNLRSLNLLYTRVTDAGVASLQRALPTCKITR
jgi:hypothetical protein